MKKFFICTVAFMILIPIAIMWVKEEKINDNVWVLLVGIGEFESANYESKYGARDSRAISQALLNIVDNNKIKLIIDEEATKERILDGIDKWLASHEDEESVVILYFSTHSTSTEMCPYDSVKYSSINNIEPNTLSKALDSLESKKIVLVFDTCYCYDYTKSLRAPSRVIFTGCSENQVCWESETLQHGIFSWFLLKAIENPVEADENNDRTLSVLEIFQYIDEGILNYFKDSPPPSPQNPELFIQTEVDIGILAY